MRDPESSSCRAALLPFSRPRVLSSIAPQELAGHAVGTAGAEQGFHGSERLPPQAVLHADLSDEGRRLVLRVHAIKVLGIADLSGG